MKLKYLLTIIFCGSVLCFPLYATPNEIQTAGLLDRIIQKIALLKKKLFAETQKKEGLTADLKGYEADIGSLSKKILLTKQQLNEKTKTLQKIEREQKENEEKLNQQIQTLKKQIYSAYMLGRQPFLKILLNQEHPEKINRYLRYYQYLNNAREKNIQNIKILVSKIKASEIYIKKQTEILQSIENKQTQQHKTLKQKRAQKQYLLSIVSKNIKGKQTQLKKLYDDKKRLQAVIERLKQEKIYERSGINFAKWKKKLIWPVSGQIIQHFGQPLVGDRLPATGILIRTKPDSKVRAVFAGKVVYAQWLNGFGLLIIVQHGKNYLTLYGHNKNIYVKVGELVQADQIIASTKNVADTPQDEALYFEIRYNGKPENPLLWLK
ncbi:MAG: peptidoglycan DD-metalloendopeptidase family protein [Gammaproteobacteria bacterium]|nr:peptidoglycan DD-metalloendopeptidase family protein [Gammaproteobacteria bacterium]